MKELVSRQSRYPLFIKKQTNKQTKKQKTRRRRRKKKLSKLCDQSALSRTWWSTEIEQFWNLLYIPWSLTFQKQIPKYTHSAHLLLQKTSIILTIKNQKHFLHINSSTSCSVCSSTTWGPTETAPSWNVPDNTFRVSSFQKQHSPIQITLILTQEPRTCFTCTLIH